MSTNQFTSQSAWISWSNAIEQEIVISEQGEFTPIQFTSGLVNSRYNFLTPSPDSPQLIPTISGVYMIQVSLTSSGATNQLLSWRVGYGTDFGNENSILTYTSKGGNRWSVNINCIRELYNVDGTTGFTIQARNNDGANDITLERLTYNVIKLY